MLNPVLNQWWDLLKNCVSHWSVRRTNSDVAAAYVSVHLRAFDEWWATGKDYPSDYFHQTRNM